MKYATVVSAASDVESPLPSVYFISPADGENPVEGQMGAFARIKFANASHEGCNESDLIGIVMHQLSFKGQQNRAYERAFQCLSEALKHIGDALVPAEVDEDKISLAHLVTESVA
jgi:hypothetical protein